jgi:protein disulfide-isomerase A1
MKYYTLFLEVVLFFALVFAEQKKFTYTPEVVALNKSNFDETVANAPQVIVKFYSPNCPHCKALAPIYEDAAKKVREQNVRVIVANIDCSTNGEICDKQKITRYPTLKFYKDGQFKAEFDQKRTVENITEFIIENSRALITIIHGNEATEFIKKFKTDEKKLLIGYFNRIGDVDYKTFEKMAKVYGNEFIYAAAGDKQAAEAVGGVVIPGIVMYKDYDEAIARNTKLSEDNISKFVNIHRIPNLDILTEENLQTYIDSKIPLAIFFYEKDIQYEKHKADLYHISKLYRDRLYFVASKSIYKDKNRLNKPLNFGIFDPKDPEFFFSFPKGKRMNQANLVQFGEAYFRHEVIPQIIEEPIKARVYENNVVTLNQENYNEIVLDESRDVCVLYYSPNCQYSKRLFPIWDYLGSRYLYQRKNITIAKFDAYNMKIPQSSPWKNLEYYPTIVMYQAVDKEAMLEEARQQNATIESYNRGIVVYSQDAVRGVKEIANFIFRSSVHQSKIYLNIMDISKFEVDDEISSDEESSSSDEDVDLDGDTALERARKRKEYEKMKKEKRLQKEALKKKKAEEKAKGKSGAKAIPKEAFEKPKTTKTVGDDVKTSKESKETPDKKKKDEL